MTLKLLTLSFLSLLLLPNAHAVPDNNGVQLPPAYTYSGTVYMPPEPAIAVWPTRLETINIHSAAKSSQINTTATVTPNQLIADIPFADVNLETCVLAAANTNGWILATQVTGLKCDNLAITDVDGLQHFTSLDYLSLNGNQISRVNRITILISL